VDFLFITVYLPTLPKNPECAGFFITRAKNQLCFRNTISSAGHQAHTIMEIVGSFQIETHNFGCTINFKMEIHKYDYTLYAKFRGESYVYVQNSKHN